MKLVTDTDSANDHEQRTLIAVKKWNETHEWPTVSSLRSLIFNADDNGFDAVVHRKGSRVFIDEEAFFKWAKDTNYKPAKTAVKKIKADTAAGSPLITQSEPLVHPAKAELEALLALSNVFETLSTDARCRALNWLSEVYAPSSKDD